MSRIDHRMHVGWWLTVVLTICAAGWLAPSLGMCENGARQPSGELAVLQRKAEEGDPKAQTELGLRYVDGTGVAKDILKAAEWFRKAALQGDAEGQLELGVMYVNGEGVRENLTEGYAWYTLSLQQGNRQAGEYLQDLNRTLTPADREKARERSAELARMIESARQPEPRQGPPRSGLAKTNDVVPSRPLAPPEVARSDSRGGKAVARPAGSFVEGKDYQRWHRVRVKDENGFAQPVEAYSLLLPHSWKVQGGVRWVINSSCPADAIQNRLTATSPNGEIRLEVFPQKNWQWYDDPLMLQNAQNSAQVGGAGCPLDRPYDAAQYLQQVLVPVDLPGATLLSHERNEPMTKLMSEQAQAANALFRANGVRIESRPSAEIGRVRWPDGRIGIALCAVAQTVSFMPNLLTGGTFASYQCQANVKTTLSGPSAREKELEKTLATIVASTRVNPEWQSAVQRVYNNIAKVEQQETAKRAAMWRQAQQEIGDLQRRTWEDSQASRDRIHESWGQVLRGVESWSEPGGGRIELSAGYNEAWSKGDGTYILSNDPLFDPSVVFQEDWKRLEKKP